MCLLILLLSAVQVLADCRPARLDASARVEQVIDGDTLRLASGKKLRLIGINTPEIDHQGSGSEPFAREARDFVERFVRQSRVIHLQYGAERQDRYGRLLAHVFDADGNSLEEALIREGLARHVVIGDNDFLMGCLARAEKQARNSRNGLWGHPYYRVAAPEERLSGFQLVRGRVLNVSVSSRGSWWIDLDSGISLQIRKPDQSRFRKAELTVLAGRSVEARGWLIPRRSPARGNSAKKHNPWILPVTHPAMLEVLP